MKIFEDDEYKFSHIKGKEYIENLKKKLSKPKIKDEDEDEDESSEEDWIEWAREMSELLDNANEDTEDDVEWHHDIMQDLENHSVQYLRHTLWAKHMAKGKKKGKTRKRESGIASRLSDAYKFKKPVPPAFVPNKTEDKIEDNPLPELTHPFPGNDDKLSVSGNL